VGAPLTTADLPGAIIRGATHDESMTYPSGGRIGRATLGPTQRRNTPVPGYGVLARTHHGLHVVVGTPPSRRRRGGVSPGPGLPGHASSAQGTEMGSA
jgi:hypothetical protein